MKQYHVLVSGFEISKKGQKEPTKLRHYRYDLEAHSLKQEGEAWLVKKGNEMLAAFPCSSTMILVEDVAVPEDN